MIHRLQPFLSRDRFPCVNIRSLRRAARTLDRQVEQTPQMPSLSQRYAMLLPQNLQLMHASSQTLGHSNRCGHRLYLHQKLRLFQHTMLPESNAASDDICVFTRRPPRWRPHGRHWRAPASACPRGRSRTAPLSPTSTRARARSSPGVHIIDAVLVQLTGQDFACGGCKRHANSVHVPSAVCTSQ